MLDLPHHPARSNRARPAFGSLLLLLMLPVLVVGCNQESELSESSQDASVGVNDTADATTEPDSTQPEAPERITDTGEQFIQECASLPQNCDWSSDANCGTCQYRIRYRADICTADSPCSDLMIYWSAFGCESEDFSNFVEELNETTPDMVFVCMQPHFPGETLPSSLGAPFRETMLFDEVFDRLKPGGDLQAWDGTNLLFGGCSIGATRYPVVAARYAEDSDWTGSEKTAACLSDGVVDVNYQREYVTAGTGSSCEGRTRRIDRTYEVGAFPCPGGDCLSFDSIMSETEGDIDFSTGVTADDFAVQDWKLMTEGRAFSAPDTRCENDVVAGAPMESLCENLEADSEHGCEFRSVPNARHCSYYTANFTRTCIDWFRGL